MSFHHEVALRYLLLGPQQLCQGTPEERSAMGIMPNLLLNSNQTELGVWILLDSVCFDFLWFKAQGMLSPHLHDQHV